MSILHQIVICEESSSYILESERARAYTIANCMNHMSLSLNNGNNNLCSEPPVNLVRQYLRWILCFWCTQMAQQLLAQQQAAAAREADMTHAAEQLQEQLLSAQAGAEESQAAAKLKQTEYENQAEALRKVCASAPEFASFPRYVVMPRSCGHNAAL